MYQLHYFPANANAAPHMLLEERLSYELAAGRTHDLASFLDVVETHLVAHGAFFLGNRLSAVDFYLVMLSRWARPTAQPPRSRPNVAKLLDTVTALPSVRRAHEREGITDDIC
jgi:glutathione S-transferase